MWTAEDYLKIACEIVGTETPHDFHYVRDLAKERRLPRPTDIQCAAMIALVKLALKSEY